MQPYSAKEYMAKVRVLKNAWRSGRITTDEWFQARDMLREDYQESMRRKMS